MGRVGSSWKLEWAPPFSDGLGHSFGLWRAFLVQLNFLFVCLWVYTALFQGYQLHWIRIHFKHLFLSWRCL